MVKQPLTVSDDVSYKGEAIPDCRDWSRQVIDRLGQERPDWVFTTGTRPRAGAERHAECRHVRRRRVDARQRHASQHRRRHVAAHER